LLSALAALVLPAGGSGWHRAARPGAGPSAAAGAPERPRPGARDPSPVRARAAAAPRPAAEAAILRPGPRYPTFLQPLPGEPPPVVPPADPGPRRRELVLTFDDGPDLFGTPLVLEALDRRGLKAIFFVNGRLLMGSKPQDLARRDLVRKLAAHGHLVANHTLSHRNVCAEPETLETEIDGNAEIIHAATGIRPLLFRSPYGARCRRLDEAARVRDLLQVGWNLDPQEWKGGGEDAIVAYVRTFLTRPGRYILLLHDMQREAVRALPRILDWIARENDRAAATGAPPIVIRDYTVFFPVRELPATGFEPLVSELLPRLRIL
jgi:peptidoglycan/xylan/chitin deacetylase (PgdA/CDA1 family)